MQKHLVSLFLLLTLGLFVPDKVHAVEQTLRVSPVIMQIQLSPDKVSSQTATIENLTDRPLPLRASLNDFLTSGEEGGYVFETTKENPLLQWIDLSETEFILAPKEKKTIQMKITTPRSIPLGGYYGILFFEPVIAGEQQQTQINSKVGILMLANVGVPDPNAKKAEILDFSPSFFNQNGTVPFVLRVQNISLNFFTAKPQLILTPIINLTNTLQPIELEEKIIFPGKIRRWTEDNAIQNLAPNIYKASLNVSTGNGQIVSNEKYFVVIPLWQTIGIVLAILVALFLLAKRKRLRKAFSELTK